MSRQDRGEAGFTLIELLVVLVIMPMIIGAIAAAMIASESGSTLTQARLTDSEHAQITSEYFLRDVQGAQYVTTTNVTGGYTVKSPQVCMNPNLQNPNADPVLALYRPATLQSAALSIGYWIGYPPGINTSPELVRDACTVTGTFTTVYNNSEMVISDDVTVSQVAATITPSAFSDEAAQGWTSTSAVASTTIDFPGTTFRSAPVFRLPVLSIAGFQTGPSSPLTVTPPLSAPFSVICLGVATTPVVDFRMCRGGSGPVPPALSIGWTVTQPTSISGIALSVAESASGYTYSLEAAPQQWSSDPPGAGP